MHSLERLEKALFYLKKENEIAKEMFEAKIQEKDIRKLRRKFKDLKAESLDYIDEQKTIIKALLILDIDVDINNLDDDFLKKIKF